MLIWAVAKLRIVLMVKYVYRARNIDQSTNRGTIGPDVVVPPIYVNDTLGVGKQSRQQWVL